MGLFDNYRQNKANIAAEQRQVGYEKDTMDTQAGYTLQNNPEDDRTVSTNIESRSDLQRWQQMLREDFDTILAQLGYKELNNGEIVPRHAESDVRCNAKCCHTIKRVLTPFYFRSVAITTVDKLEINRTMKTTLSVLTIDLTVNSTEYALKDVSTAQIITSMTENIIFPILTRSLGGFTKREDTSARRILERPDMQTAQKQGIFAKIGLT